MNISRFRNTAIYSDNGTTKVILYSTKIVEWNHNRDSIILNNGGWMTVTTKRRMNQVAEKFDLGFTVYQKDFEWYVVLNGQTLPFENGRELRGRKR